MFTQKHANAIARKLGCVLVEGRKHKLAEVYFGGKVVASFGIRRASKETSHGFIPQQLHITQKECRELHDGTLTKERYVEILREKGQIPS